jgi:hypothetical protein
MADWPARYMRLVYRDARPSDGDFTITTTACSWLKDSAPVVQAELGQTLRAASRATAAAPAAAASRCSSRTRAFHLAAFARAAAVAAAAAVMSDAAASPRRPPSAAPCGAGAHNAAGRQMRPKNPNPTRTSEPRCAYRTLLHILEHFCTGAGRASKSSTGCGAGPGQAARLLASSRAVEPARRSASPQGLSSARGAE